MKFNIVLLILNQLLDFCVVFFKFEVSDGVDLIDWCWERRIFVRGSGWWWKIGSFVY